MTWCASTRTRTEEYLGYWEEAADPADSGDHAIHTVAENSRDMYWMRVRSNGPLDFGTGTGRTYTERDQIEVVEARHGAEIPDTVADYNQARERETQERRLDEERWRREDRARRWRWLTRWFA